MTSCQRLQSAIVVQYSSLIHEWHIHYLTKLPCLCALWWWNNMSIISKFFNRQEKTKSSNCSFCAQDPATEFFLNKWNYRRCYMYHLLPDTDSAGVIAAQLVVSFLTAIIGLAKKMLRVFQPHTDYRCTHQKLWLVPFCNTYENWIWQWKGSQ